jgi:hypothetical protein
MRPHSKTELTAFFIKSLIERMISEWRNVTMFCLMWIAALLPIHSDFVQGFFLALLDFWGNEGSSCCRPQHRN